MLVDNGPIACKTPYEWCIQNFQKVPLLLQVLLHCQRCNKKLKATFELGNKTEQNVNLLSLRPNKQIHPQVNHHYVIASSL
jgi:hypothetical protein